MRKRSSTHPFDIMAYADDLISSDPKRLAKAEERLHDDPEAAARVSEYLWQNREIRRLYSGILDEPVPAHLQDLVQNSHTSLRIVPPVRIAITLAASALLLILTTGIPQKHWPAGRFGHSSTSGTSVSRTVAGSAMPATPARGILGWNAEKPEAVTLSVHPPKLMRYRLSPDELLLAVNGHDEASFSYVAPNGQELKFFVSIRRPYQLASPQIVNSENTTTVYWMDGPLACGLSGSMRPQELLPLARKVCSSTLLGLLAPSSEAREDQRMPEPATADKEFLPIKAPAASIPLSSSVIATAAQVGTRELGSVNGPAEKMSADWRVKR